MRALYDAALLHGEKTFVVYGRERYSFVDFHHRAATLARRLQSDFGIGPGDRIAIAMRNYPEWCLAYMAATAIGAIAVTLNSWWEAQELNYGLEDSGSRLLFADAERFRRVQPFLAARKVEPIVVRPELPLPAGAREFGEVLGSIGADPFPDVDVDSDADAAICYTSGSSGYPKGVIQTHRGIVAAMLGWEMSGLLLILRAARERATLPRERPDLAMLLTVPLFHVNGSHAQFLLSFRLGRKVVFMSRWDPEEALELIERERVTEFHGVPTMTGDLVQAEGFKKRDLSSLRDIGGGGSARPAEQVRQILRGYSGTASGVYGLTETNAIGTTIGKNDYAERPTSAGRAVPPIVEMKIVDDSGREVPLGTTGEILLKGCMLMRAYWNKPEETAEVLQDGWLRTGDIGHIDEEGFLFITDRAKDIVIRGGENISTLEVEDKIHEHDAVLEAAVFGVPDERLVEALAAVVVVKPRRSLSHEELEHHLRERVAHFKIPQHVWIRTEQLPRIAAGKIAKRQLRDEAKAELERR
jgi:acyl-CoA synthetase (AMP-forming)/AMP-acid ligase II